MSMESTSQLTARFSWVVYGWLIALTAVEVAVVMMKLPKIPGVIMMVGTTLGKSILIILYFMHLKFDRRLVWFLAGVPLLLAVLFVIALFPDIVFHKTLRM